MPAFRTVGAGVAAIGAILVAIVGIIELAGFVAEAWLSGLTWVVLGIGLLLFCVSWLKKQA